ncbi:hypothetical protein NKG94_40280 [Micromonospora sp. M12]
MEDQHHMFRKTGILLTAALLGLTATIGGAGPAAAAPADTSNGAVSLGKLILEPTERGYHGSIPLTVTNTGSETGYLHHAARTGAGLLPGGCFRLRRRPTDSGDDRRVLDCGLTADQSPLARVKPSRWR